jgi:hypothetical protein
MEGLISAARPVAFVTNLLIEMADRRRALRHSLVRATHCRVERSGRRDRAARRGVACQCQCQGQSHVRDTRTARSRCQGGHRGMQDTREARAFYLGEAGREGGCGLQKHGGARVQETRDGAAGRDFAFGEGTWARRDIGWGQCVVQVSHRRDRLVSLDYTTMDLNARRHVGLCSSFVPFNFSFVGDYYPCQ